MKISRRANLDRYYLFQTKWLSVFLHKIHHDEKVGVYHSHPWSWFSILLWGQYDDHRFRRTRRVRFWNRCRAGVAHRVTLPKGSVWTLCFHGARKCRWGVFDESGDCLEWEPWRGVENQDRKDYA